MRQTVAHARKSYQREWKNSADGRHHPRTERLHEEAQDLFERALANLEASLGADHPALAENLAQLARLFESQQRYDEAEPLLKRAVELTGTALGPDHPSLLYYRERYRELLDKMEAAE